MSIARDYANNLDDVAPFIAAGRVARTVVTRVSGAMDTYRNADDRARFAIEGGPIQPADVPGASTPITTQGA